MSIALVTSTLEGGGAARVMVNMAEYWARAGHGVTLISFEDGSSPSFYPVHPDVRIVYLGLLQHSATVLHSLKNNWARLRKIRREVLGCQPDIAISFIDTANIRVILSLLWSGVGVLVSERVDPKQERIGLFWSMLRYLTYPLASCVVVQTRQAGKFFASYPLRALQVIPNTVQSRDMPHERLRHNEGKTLLAVGRLYEQKGYDLLLRAFSRVAKNCTQWTLCIAGQGPLMRKLEHMIEQLGLEGRVRLLGHVHDVEKLMSQADAYVLSSLYEGFPNSLCEAMAYGLACISTDCPSGPADIITHDHDGLLVSNGNEDALVKAMDRLLGDQELRLRLSGNARDIVRRYSEKKIMDQWESCINKAVGENEN